MPPTTGSMLASTFLLAGSQALGILTAPGPKRGTLKDLAYNPGGASSVIPYICGTVETIPHLVNYFDYATKKVKNDVAIEDIALTAGLDGLAGYVAGGGTFGIAGAPDPPTAYQGLAVGAVLGAIVAGLGAVRTASYRHYCGFFYVICHGRIDGISIVKVDERPVASGNDSNAGDTIFMDDPQAWGGDHKDGGVLAVCDIIPGDFWPTQQPNAYLVGMLGATVPAYQGKACFVIRGPSHFHDGVLFSYNESGYFAANPGAAPALRPLKLRVHRYPNNLGVPEFKKVNTSGYNSDANPAEACYEWLTSASFGVKKLSASRIDVDSFRAGAETHFDEGLGVSLEFNSAVDVETALDTFSQLADVVIFGGFRTGTIKYKVIRRDYSIPALDVFRRGPDGSSPEDYNVIRAEGFTPGTWAATANMFQFEYIDRDNNFLPTTRYVQDLANRMLTGQTRSLVQSLEGVSNGAEAALVGTREMRAGSYPRPPLTLTTNRDAYAKEPGDVIKYIDNVDNYTKILRIAEVQGGAEDNSEIKLICVEDQYGVGSSAYTEFVPPVWEDPVGTPAAAADATVIEAPYFLTRDDDARLLAFAAKPNNAQLDFDTYISTDAGATYALDSAHTDFAIVGTITEAVARLSAAVLTSLTFTPASAFEASRLTSATATQIAAGANVLYWETTGEFMAVETVTDNGDGTFTLTNIWRAVHPYDSVPTPQAEGERVWFFTYGRTVSNDEFVAATATRTKILPRTVSATLPLADATSINVTVDSRSLKPNPVRNVLLNTGYLTDEIGATDDVRVDWNESNRLTEATVVAQDEAGVTPEATTTYTVRWYATESGSVLLRTESGIVAATGTQTATMTAVEEVASANYLGHLALSYRVEIDVVRDGYTSTTYIRELTRTSPVLLGDFIITEASDFLTTEADDFLITESVGAVSQPWNEPLARVKPAFGARLQTGKPLATGLVCYAIPGGSHHWEYVSKSMIVSGGGAARWTSTQSRYGASAEFNNAGGQQGFNWAWNPLIGLITSNMSVVFLARISALQTYCHFFNFPYSNSAWSAPYLSMSLQRDNNTSSLIWNYASAGSLIGIASDTGLVVADNVFHTIGATRQGASVVFYKDGVKFGATKTLGTNTATDWGGRCRPTLFDRASGQFGEQPTGAVVMAAAWGRTLSAAEMLQIHAAPFSLLTLGDF